MKKLKVLFISLLLAGFAAASEIKHITSFDEGIELAKSQNKKVLLFVYSTYCPWCKKMERTTLKDKEVVDYVNEKYVFIALNQDTDDIPPRFLPYGVPTTYAIDPKKEEKLFTMKGYKKTSSFLGRLKLAD